MLVPSGVPLSERDPGAVPELLLAGQSERGVSGREGERSAGHPGQGAVSYLLIGVMLEHKKLYSVTLPCFNFRASDGSPPCCLKSSPA